MIGLFFIAGGVCFSWQPLLARYISNMSGDFYTVHLAVLLGFIFFGAIGNMYAINNRRTVPLIEIVSGTLMLFVADFADIIWNDSTIASYPVLAAIFLIAVPGLVLGMHVPFYASYVGGRGFSLGYALYALGGVLAILCVEYYFTVDARYLSKTMMFFGFLQIALGVILFILCKKDLYKAREKIKIFTTIKSYKSEIIKVFLFSVTSFIIYYWAMRTHNFLLRPFRMQSGILLASSLFTVSIGAFIGLLVQRANISFFKNNINILGMMILTIIASVALYQPLMDLMIFVIPWNIIESYIASSFAIAFLLMLPCVWSSVFFANLTTSAMEKLPSENAQVPSAIFLLIAAISNVVGIFIGVATVKYLWDGAIYFIVPVIIIPTIFVLLDIKKIKYSLKNVGFLVVAIISFFCIVLYVNFLDTIVSLKIRTYFYEKNLEYKKNDITLNMGHLTSMLMLPIKIFSNYQNFFNNDGIFVLLSKDDKIGETLQGRIAGYYFNTDKVNRALVIGSGSGQTAFGVSYIAKHVDIVDVEESTKKNLKITKEYNGNLYKKEKIKIIKKDAFSFVRENKNKYDIIINTATNPASYSANKLYTDEFVKSIKKMLEPEGVYIGYFPSAFNKEEMEVFLTPIATNFDIIDLWYTSYPTYIAYNKKRQKFNNAINVEYSLYQDGFFLFKGYGMTNIEIYDNLAVKRDVKIKLSVKNTLDRNVIENITVRKMLK